MTDPIVCSACLRPVEVCDGKPGIGRTGRCERAATGWHQGKGGELTGAFTRELVPYADHAGTDPRGAALAIDPMLTSRVERASATWILTYVIRNAGGWIVADNPIEHAAWTATAAMVGHDDYDPARTAPEVVL